MRLGYGNLNVNTMCRRIIIVSDISPIVITINKTVIALIP